MNFKKIHLSKLEHKILKVLNRYFYANAYELRGYFDFIGIDKILTSVQNLQKINLIFYEEPRKSYGLTSDGEKYINYHRNRTIKNFRNFIFSILGAIAAIVTIVEFFG